MQKAKHTIDHIVIADDDSDDISMFQEAIKQLSSSLKISMVDDGVKLLRFLELDLPDLIFLDLNMPIMNGQECLRAIRSNQKLDSIPVIIYSTTSNPIFIDQCYSHGANYYMVKPYSFQNITKLLERVLTIDWKNATAPERETFLLKS